MHAFSSTAGWLRSTSVADPAQQHARHDAAKLYGDIARGYGCNPKGWASMNGAAHALSRVALPYSLKRLSEWLSRGGMALGAPCVLLGDGVLIKKLFQMLAPCVFAYRVEGAAWWHLYAACGLPDIRAHLPLSYAMRVRVTVSTESLQAWEDQHALDESELKSHL